MSSQEQRRERPLSPHLTIYKTIPTMAMSIVHRITGVGLYIGMIFLGWWLLAAASSKEYFDFVNGLWGSLLGQLVLFCFALSLVHHMLGGIKHLIWDLGYGFDKDHTTKMAKMQPIASVVLTVLIFIIGYIAR